MSVATTLDGDGTGPIVRRASRGVALPAPHRFEHDLGDTVSVNITGTVIERTNAVGGDKYWLEYPISHGRTARKWVDARDLVGEAANDD